MTPDGWRVHLSAEEAHDLGLEAGKGGIEIPDEGYWALRAAHLGFVCYEQEVLEEDDMRELLDQCDRTTKGLPLGGHE